jgi:hypothetical protein
MAGSELANSSYPGLGASSDKPSRHPSVPAGEGTRRHRLDIEPIFGPDHSDFKLGRDGSRPPSAVSSGTPKQAFIVLKNLQILRSCHVLM